MFNEHTKELISALDTLTFIKTREVGIYIDDIIMAIVSELKTNLQIKDKGTINA